MLELNNHQFNKVQNPALLHGSGEAEDENFQGIKINLIAECSSNINLPEEEGVNPEKEPLRDDQKLADRVMSSFEHIKKTNNTSNIGTAMNIMINSNQGQQINENAAQSRVSSMFGMNY